MIPFLCSSGGSVHSKNISVELVLYPCNPCGACDGSKEGKFNRGREVMTNLTGMGGEQTVFVYDGALPLYQERTVSSFVLNSL